ncbi:MAG TPA: hypothetical protein VGQ12_00530 [Candidatus Angelobacter sp.]|nr:hypothetical protein [Candidatus Angelobacter sp.]
MKHEEFIKQVRDIVAANVGDMAIRERLLAAKLVYGIGDGSYRGICYFGAWQNGHPTATELVEIAATGEESPVQLAGTTIHELAHVLAGSKAGHGREWLKACEFLGLRKAKAAGTRYSFAHFSPAIRAEVVKLATISDGKPVFGGEHRFTGLPKMKLRPCPLGIGVRGGKSRGTGSGSRLRKFICGCEKPVIVRAAADELKATCDVCKTAFQRADKGGPGTEPDLLFGTRVGNVLIVHPVEVGAA